MLELSIEDFEQLFKEEEETPEIQKIPEVIHYEHEDIDEQRHAAGEPPAPAPALSRRRRHALNPFMICDSPM